MKDRSWSPDKAYDCDEAVTEAFDSLRPVEPKKYSSEFNAYLGRTIMDLEEQNLREASSSSPGQVLLIMIITVKGIAGVSIFSSGNKSITLSIAVLLLAWGDSLPDTVKELHLKYCWNCHLLQKSST